MVKSHGSPFTIEGSIWINKGEDCFIGPGRVALLNVVIQEGSINAAAKKLNISYQQAWKTIDQMNRLSPIPILIPKRGGKDGGGVEPTAYGRKIIAEINRLEKEFSKFLLSINKEFDPCF